MGDHDDVKRAPPSLTQYPTPMGDKIRTYVCTGCGAECRRYRRNNEPRVCIDCATLAVIAGVHAMVSRTGPAWEAHQRNPGGRPRKSPPPTE